MPFALWSDGRDGWDRCTLSTTDTGHLLRGTVRRAAAELGYAFEVGRDWAVERVVVEAGERGLEITRDGTRWRTADGRDLPDLDGCLDVACDFTPAPLAPHFRRLGLRPGDQSRCDVVVVEVAGLAPRRGDSRVAHVDEHHWHHELDGHLAQVHLGAQGLVVEHDAGWSALAVG